jgi:hypothetical protein
MLHRLRDHISNCYARAADARRLGDATNNAERKADLLLMEENWKRLAQSYELTEQLERALMVRSHDIDQRIEWQRAANAPFDRLLELAVIGAAGIDAIAFPCRRILKGWVAASSGEPLDVQPTHWREWRNDGAMPRSARARGHGGTADGRAGRVPLLPR